MIVNSAVDIRCKDRLDTPLLYTTLTDFFLQGAGVNQSDIYDVLAVYDVLSSRFVLWTTSYIAANAAAGTNYQYYLVAVSKNSDPTEGWNFMIVETGIPYHGTVCAAEGPCVFTANTSYTDATHIGFGHDALYLTSNIFSGSSISFGSPSYIGTAIWIFPKVLPNISSVFQADVPVAVQGVHYSRLSSILDFNYDSAAAVGATRTLAGEGLGSLNHTFVVTLGTLIRLDSMSFNTSGRNATSYQYIDILSGDNTEQAPQKGAPNYPLTPLGGQIYDATLTNNRIYIVWGCNARTGTPTSMQYAVVNVANLTDGPPDYLGFRTFQGAFTEAEGFLNVSALGLDANVLFPRNAVDIHGNMGGFQTIFFSIQIPSLDAGIPH